MITPAGNHRLEAEDQVLLRCDKDVLPCSAAGCSGRTKCEAEPPINL